MNRNVEIARGSGPITATGITQNYPAGAIEMQLSELDNAINNLSESLGDFTHRIERILRRVPEQASAVNGKPENWASTEVPLADELQNFSRKVKGMISAVGELNERVSL
jgi:methyl-accepting chemotaxis protein